MSFPPTDPTLTLTNLIQWLQGVDWHYMSLWLCIPASKYTTMEAAEAPLHEACCEWYLTNHPAPSWIGVAQALYNSLEHEVLALLGDRVSYLKGGSNDGHACNRKMQKQE